MKKMLLILVLLFAGCIQETEKQVTVTRITRFINCTNGYQSVVVECVDSNGTSYISPHINACAVDNSGLKAGDTVKVDALNNSIQNIYMIHTDEISSIAPESSQ